MSDPAQTEIVKEVSELIDEYSKYESSDQVIVFGLVWMSILASATAALLTALENGSKALVAIIAAIPALCLAIESSFKFSQQYQLRRAATADLLALRDELQYEGLASVDGSKRKREIVRAFKTGSYVPTLSAASGTKTAPPSNVASR
jgi:hypothetical protein